MRCLTYQPHGGEHLFHAAREASMLARAHRRVVRFRFNDCDLVAAPKKSPHTILWEWERDIDRAAYTPKAKAQRAEYERWLAAETNRRQLITDQLFGQLAAASKDEAVLMAWLSSFAEVADWIGLKWDRDDLGAVLLAAGYIENQHVGQPRTFFNTREHIAQYVIGQVLNCLNVGMPPHPVTVGFCNRYFALPARSL